MLEKIAEYAVAEGVAFPPGFTVKAVKWLIQLGPEGQFIGVQPLGSGGKSPGKEFRNCPEFPANEMQSGGKAHPLVESANVVALLSKNRDEVATPKDESKQAYFLTLLRELAATLPEADISAQALEDAETLQTLRDELWAQKAKPTDKVTVSVSGKVLVEQPEVFTWWSARRKGEDEPDGTFRCLVTGELTNPLASHPKIGGLGAVGGLAIGSSLISFDKGAFASYGLDQSANAAVSEEAAMSYRAGLNHLIQRGKKLGPIIVTYWYSGLVVDDNDPLDFLIGDDSVDKAAALVQMGKLLEAIKAGQRQEIASYRYYALSLSGAAGRVMLRDWQEGPYEELVQNVYAWFDDMSIVTSDGRNTINPPKFIAIAATTVRELDNLEAPMLTALWKSAFQKTEIPLSAIRGALNRTRIDIIENQMRPIRMGLLKAYIARNTKDGAQMKPYLNPDHPSIAYQAGRLMAVLAYVQEKALKNVNANIVQRFYPAASSTPALVFGRLTRQSQFHLHKIDDGLARILEKKIAEIWGKVQADLPATFSLEEQSLFALGYYQQMAQDIYDRIEGANARKNKDNDDLISETA